MNWWILEKAQTYSSNSAIVISASLQSAINPRAKICNSSVLLLMLYRRFGQNVPAWGPLRWPIIWEIRKGCTFTLNNSVRRSISHLSMSFFPQDMASDLRCGWWLWWRQDVLAR